MSTDANNQPVNLGDIVMLANYGKSAGISWRKLKVSRLTDKSFWSTRVRVTFRGGGCDEVEYEDGPHRLSNCIVVERGA